EVDRRLAERKTEDSLNAANRNAKKLYEKYKEDALVEQYTEALAELYAFGNIKNETKAAIAYTKLPTERLSGENGYAIFTEASRRAHNKLRNQEKTERLASCFKGCPNEVNVEPIFVGGELLADGSSL